MQVTENKGMFLPGLAVNLEGQVISLGPALRGRGTLARVKIPQSSERVVVYLLRWHAPAGEEYQAEIRIVADNKSRLRLTRVYIEKRSYIPKNP